MDGAACQARQCAERDIQSVEIQRSAIHRERSGRPAECIGVVQGQYPLLDDGSARVGVGTSQAERTCSTLGKRAGAANDGAHAERTG